MRDTSAAPDRLAAQEHDNQMATGTPPGTIYAIGDVHGCAPDLRRLLETIRLDAAIRGEIRPRVVQVGDLVDRGPDSRGVLDLVMSAWFADNFNATVLRGNHEQWLLDARTDLSMAEMWLHNGGAETVESFGVAFGGDGIARVLARFFERIPYGYLRFLEDLPCSLRENGLLFVHAGIDPRVPLASQREAAMLWIREPFLSHTGDYGVRVVHGHTVTAEVTVRPNRIGIDTGAGFGGGRLSAVAIAPDGAVRIIRPNSPF